MTISNLSRIAQGVLTRINSATPQRDGLTQRTITERMEEDPVYFEKISALIQRAIDDHRAQRISQLEFLNIVRDAREQVVRPKHDDVPQYLRGNDTAGRRVRVARARPELRPP